MTEIMEYTHGVDTPRLRKYLEHITAHPETWKQNSWAHDWNVYKKTFTRSQAPQCGTAYCLAGHVVIGEGYDLEFKGFTAFYTTDGQSIPFLAAELLGIEPPNRLEIHLFTGTNSLLDLWTIANRLTQGEIEIPPHLLVNA